MSAEVAEPLHDLVGGHLVAVTFFADYQRVEFDGPGDGEEQTLEVYARSSLRYHGHELMSGEPGYRDALCEQLGTKVQGARTEARDIVIEFDAEAALIVSLHPEDAAGPEAAYYVRLSKDAVVSRMVW